VFNATFSNISAISWQEQVNFQCDDYEVRFVLDQHAYLCFHSASSLKRTVHVLDQHAELDFL
jgi:hypothetical protein